jgi:predicted KAP-like P-loop ATPase
MRNNYPRHLLGDKPINSPDDDALGLSSFADALAISLTQMAPEEGLVLSVEGEWGSGKTSALELMHKRIVIRELARERKLSLEQVEGRTWSAIEAEWVELKDIRQTHIVRFNPWNFSGQENLVKAFFREVGLAIGHPPNGAVAKAIKKVSDYLPSVGFLVGGGVGLATGGVAAGGVGSGAGRAVAESAQRKLNKTRSLEELKSELSDALRKSEKVIVVVIDDLDRLLPSEMRALFSLVKSLGDLPTVRYVLSFDRNVVISALAKGLDGVEAEFLEKIVQVPLKLPPPWNHEIRALFFDKLNSTIGESEPSDPERWRHVYTGAVAPYFETPRDVARFTNTFRVIWPNVVGDVDLTDLIILVVLQIFEPAMFDIVFQNIELLSGEEISWDDKKIVSRFDTEKANDPEAAKKALSHLFPVLAKEWNSHTFDRDVYLRKREQRRICTREYYRNYFLFGRDSDQVSREEIEMVLSDARPQIKISELVERLGSRQTRKGASRIASLLEQIFESVFAKPLLTEPVTSALLSLSDDLIKREDRVWELFVRDNIERLESIIVYGLEPLTTAERVDRVMTVARSADGLSLGARVIDRLAGYHGLFGGKAKHDDERYVEEAIILKAAKIVLARIRKSAKNGTLLSEVSATRLLFIWMRWANPSEVRKWISTQIRFDAQALRLAEIIPQSSYQSGGDGSKVVRFFKAKDFEPIVDLGRLKTQLDRIARKAGSDSDASRIRSEFLDAETAGNSSGF